MRSPATTTESFAGSMWRLSAALTCSGVSACVVALGLYLTGAKEAAIYDGSWAEWGSREDTAIVTGA